MCGICGVVSGDQRQIEPAVRAMMRAMIHRATGDCLIFNGEIYNFRWLRAKLESLGANVRSSGDTEVLLHSLVAWGEKALDQIDGMYAFAFYHAASRRVLLARDPFGIKPLYVAQAQQAFVFASEVRTVLASGLVPDDLDSAGIASMLAYGAPQDPLTIHRAIKSFPAGSCEWVGAEAAAGRGSAHVRRFWRFPNVGQAFDEQTAVRRVQVQLNASVRDQCISDVPMGVFLSGGIDSATLAAVARSHLSPLNTFSIGFESAGGTDELADAAATARALGTHHVQTVLDDEWIRLQWSEWLQSADRPSIDGLNTFVVSGVVKQGGATVALSGLGADELFGGYPCFAKARKLHRLLKPLVFVPPRLRRSAAARCGRSARRRSTRSHPAPRSTAPPSGGSGIPIARSRERSTGPGPSPWSSSATPSACRTGFSLPPNRLQPASPTLGFMASPHYCSVPFAFLRVPTRSSYRRPSPFHAVAGETLPRHHHLLPGAGDARREFRQLRDPRIEIQPASENSSGVTIRGGCSPSVLRVSYRAGSKSAFAMCLQFHVSK